MLAWGDYHLVLEVARAQGLAGAAEKLGVTFSTVFRRLERVEEELGAKLFERLRSGYVPTDTGGEIVRAAERMEQEALAGDRAVTGRDQQLVGRLVVTATEVLATCFLARHLPHFCAAHPGLSIELVSDNRRLSLVDREADIAIRPRRPQEESLVARKVGTLGWGIFASPETARRIGQVRTLADLVEPELVCWDGGAAAREVQGWIEAAFENPKVTCRSSSMMTVAALVAHGRACAALPFMLANMWPGLQPVYHPLPGLAAELWIVTHQDLRRNARVRALLDFLAGAARGDVALNALARESG
ncbi:LysR family transcriptional regulator [Rhizobiales bacterium]|uniref:LysR family transcriptional regulator n=1 Tax=Hongsoonwoonella zoysiae TaxID=2821844 RepID=UPI00156160CF|nr:LysR family transcriptional regulator [Hongsoonwoonella zoysiae]NRG16380.1 LysR family transcriptional regulator [Hongsoonwoonella zoysiae]